MLYRHKITGAVIDVDSTMGGDWQEVKSAGRPTRAADQGAEKPTPEKAVKKNVRTVRKPG